MDQQNPTLAKIPILDTGKFEQWQFRIQQYFHYSLWEVIVFGDSYEAPTTNATTGSVSEGTATNKGRTVALTTEDIQKRRNDVKARTTLLLFLPDEHQLRFSKYKTAQELWAAILKTFGGNEATKKTKKNMLKQQYGNFKAKGLAPEWLMHTIVWRNRSDLDTMSLDDLYNHLKVYESEVQKKSKSNSHNMDFISSAKSSSGKEDVNTASIPTASTNASPASVNIGAVSISQDTACAYIASQSSGSQIKFEDITQIDEDDMKEMDIKWNMALLSMRADKFWKKTWKKISIQGNDVAGFDKSKVECFNCHKMGHFVRECRAPKSQDRGRRDNYRQGSKVEEQAPKALMEWDGIGASWQMKKRIMLCKNMLFHKAGLSQVEGLPEFADDTITNYTRPSPSVESNPNDLQNSSSSASENGESTAKSDKKETVRKPSVKYAKLYRKPTKRSNVRGNQRNWNNLKSQQLGNNFVMKKACYNCGGIDHLSYDCGKRVDHRSSWAKNSNTHKSKTPRTVFHKTSRPPMRTNRPYMNAAQHKRTFFYKPTHSYNKRPFQRTSAVRSQFRGLRVATVNRKFPTVNRKLPTVNRKFHTGNTKFSTTDMGNKGKAIKASACWIWKPLQNLSNKGPNSNSVSVMFKNYTYIDTQGRLKSVMAWVPKEN
nr:hypothetical protein [Tanacetum cinerariifolium]